MRGKENLNFTLVDPPLIVQDKLNWQINNLEWDIGNYNATPFEMVFPSGTIKRVTFNI